MTACQPGPDAPAHIMRIGIVEQERHRDRPDRSGAAGCTDQRRKVQEISALVRGQLAGRADLSCGAAPHRGDLQRPSALDGSLVHWYLSALGSGPLWFVLVLLVLDTAYALTQDVTRRRPARENHEVAQPAHRRTGWS